MYSVSLQYSHLVHIKDCWLKLHHSSSHHTRISLEITSWSEPGVESSLSHSERYHTRQRHCHYRESIGDQWKRMDPLHSSKVSTSRRTLDHVLKTWWHKNNFRKTLVGLLFLLHLGNCITTISVPQASSPIIVKFDTCLAIPCGNLKNKCYIQGLEIYIHMWPSPLNCPLPRKDNLWQ
jgi:hypothetical protein